MYPQSLESCLSKIKEGAVKPLYILFGEDDVRSDEIIRALKKHYFADERYNGPGFKYLYLLEESLEDGITFLKSISLFEDKKLLVLKNLEKIFDSYISEKEKRARKKGETSLLEQFLDIAKKEKNSTTVANLSFSKNYERVILDLKIQPYLVNLYYPSEQNLKSYLERIAKEEGYKITQKAYELLFEYCGEDYSLIFSEYSKAKIYAVNRIIDEEVIAKTVAKSIKEKLKNLLFAFAKKDKEKVLRILENLILSGTEPEEIVGATTLFLIKRLLGVDRMGFGYWTDREIIWHLNTLAKIDHLIKKGEVDNEVLLLNWFATSVK